MIQYLYDSNRKVLVEVKETGVHEVVASDVRSPADGQTLAQIPALLDTAQLAEKTWLWMLENVNPATLPTELQPLRLHLTKVRQTLSKVGR